MIMPRIQFLIDRTRQLDSAINKRARSFAKKNRWLGRLERGLDVIIWAIFGIAVGLDYVVTGLCCDHPSLEAHPLARYLMELYGIRIGLGLAAVVSLIIILGLSYGLYRFSSWHMRRVNLEFPVLRKLGTYSILLIAALKGVNGAFSWLPYSYPSGYAMTVGSCACLLGSDGWQTSTIRDNGTVADYPLGSVFVAAAEQVDGGVRIRFVDSLSKRTECRIVAIGSDDRMHVGERTCRVLSNTAGRIRSTTLVFPGLQLEEIEAFRFQRRPFLAVLLAPLSAYVNQIAGNRLPVQDRKSVV